MKPIEPGCLAITKPPWVGKCGVEVLVIADVTNDPREVERHLMRPGILWHTSGAPNSRNEIQHEINEICLMRIDGHEEPEEITREVVAQ